MTHNNNKSNDLIAVVFVIIFLAIMIPVLLFVSHQVRQVAVGPSKVSGSVGSLPLIAIQNATVGIDYTSGVLGYFGGQNQSLVLNSTQEEGAQFSLVLNFDNSDMESAHSITSIQVQPPFKLVSESPGISTNIPINGNIAETLIIQAPDSIYHGNLRINISTS